MSIGHDPIADLFVAARELEPREQEIADAVTLAMSEPQRSSARARIANIVRVLGALIGLAVAFAVGDVLGFGANAPKKHPGHVELVEAVGRESSVMSAAVMVRVLLALQVRDRRQDAAASLGLFGSNGLDVRVRDADGAVGVGVTAATGFAVAGADHRRLTASAANYLVSGEIQRASLSAASAGPAGMRVRRRGPSRRLRCACERQMMRPPPRSLAGAYSRARG